MDFTTKLQDLSDLELAILLCYVANQHTLLIYADEDLLPEVAQELESVKSQSLDMRTKRLTYILRYPLRHSV
jgi:hypothetical protein